MDLKKKYGYFGPNSMFWRVWRERIQITGGVRAIVLQLSHPLVAAGVAKYSSFQKDPLGRLNRTLDIMNMIVFGSKSEANEALKRLGHVHKYVQGYLPHRMGIFKKGTFYDANNPELKLWVYATLIDTGLKVHQLFVGTLKSEEKDKFIKESTLFAELLGIPKEITPKTLKDFEQYVFDMYKSGVIVPTVESKKQLEDILNPNIPMALKTAIPFVNFITVGLLPQFLQVGYGFGRSKVGELRFKGLAKAVRILIPLLPQKIHFSPYYITALKKSHPR